MSSHILLETSYSGSHCKWSISQTQREELLVQLHFNILLTNNIIFLSQGFLSIHPSSASFLAMGWMARLSRSSTSQKFSGSIPSYMRKSLDTEQCNYWSVCALSMLDKVLRSKNKVCY